MKSLGNGQYEITNKKTGKTKVVSQFQLSQYGITPPPAQEEKKGRNPIVDLLLGAGLNVAQDVGTSIRSVANRGTAQKEMEAAKLFSQLGQNKTAQNIYESTSNESKDIAGSFSGDVNQNPLWRGLKTGSEIAAIAEVPALAKGAYKFTRRLSPKYAARETERLTEKAGKIAPEIIEKHFGTTRQPLQSLYQGVATPGDEATALKFLRKNIANLGQSSGGMIPEPTYRQFLNFRRASGQAAKFGKNQSPTLENLLQRKLYHAYNAALKEGVPQIAGPDKMYSLMKGLQGGIGKATGAVPYAIGGGITAGVTYRLLNSLFGGSDR